MNIYTYIRVSTQKQDLDIQRDEVIKYCKYKDLKVIRSFEDIASGKNIDRPGFSELMKTLENNPQGIEAVIIWKLDRIGRSIRDLINISDFLQRKNVGLVAITSNIDTTTKEGRLFFYLMSAIAEYERELIMERTSIAIDAAKASGVICNRPRKQIDHNEVNRQLLQGVAKSRIAKNLKISRGTLYNRIKERKQT